MRCFGMMGLLLWGIWCLVGALLLCRYAGLVTIRRFPRVADEGSTRLQCGCEARMPISEVVSILYTLNIAVPSLALNIPRFPRDPAVQAPLRSLFSIYIDMLLVTIDCFTAERSRACEMSPILLTTNH